MSKEQILIDGKIKLGHSSGTNDDTEFVFSSDKRGEITITLIRNYEEKTHIECTHKIMNDFVPYLVEWLQEKLKLQN